jgi:O-acetyl-ADP-ribose deacetylase (regulator of RNase III)
MSMNWTTGHIFDSPCQTLTIPVNCAGVMEMGLALAFRQRYPRTAEEYRNDCRRRRITTGDVYLYDARLHGEESPRYVLLFPTRWSWRDPSCIESIRAGLERFRGWFAPSAGDAMPPITSIAFPALGCGEGGLDWTAVKPVLAHYLDDLPVPVEVYEPLDGCGQ